jgi:hypothetical protein
VLAFLVLALGASVMPAFAEEGEAGRRLRSEFWIDLKPVAAVGDIWPLPPEKAERLMLEEAAWVFSGMIWGFEFSYTPLDQVRALSERFELRSLGSIAVGDSRLDSGDMRVAKDEVRSWIEYRPDPVTLAGMARHDIEPWRGTQGLGKADLVLGLAGRRAAYEDATREALRALLRSLEPNKPRLVKGRVVFERVPSITIAHGAYMVQARLRVEVVEILSYNVY